MARGKEATSTTAQQIMMWYAFLVRSVCSVGGLFIAGDGPDNACGIGATDHIQCLCSTHATGRSIQRNLHYGRAVNFLPPLVSASSSWSSFCVSPSRCGVERPTGLTREKHPKESPLWESGKRPFPPLSRVSIIFLIFFFCVSPSRCGFDTEAFFCPSSSRVWVRWSCSVGLFTLDSKSGLVRSDFDTEALLYVVFRRPLFFGL